MHDILSYLAAAYDPIAIIVYGSFADGTSNLFSDFDALLVTADGERRHDDRFVDFTQLDVFVHPLSDFQGEYDPAEYARIYGGQILLDRDGVAAALLERVTQWVDSRAKKTQEELDFNVSWCEKTLRRAERTDAEGCFRRHWLLVEGTEKKKESIMQGGTAERPRPLVWFIPMVRKTCPDTPPAFSSRSHNRPMRHRQKPSVLR